MICYFRKRFKLSIKIEIEQKDRESVIFEEMMQKAVNIEIKTGLRSSTIVRDLDAYCPQSHCSSHATLAKVQTQEFNTKKFKRKESRPKESKLAKDKTLAAPRFKSTKLGKTSRIDKKGSILRKNKAGKKIPWQLEIMSMPLRRVRRSKITKVTGGAIIAKKRDIFQKTARNLQKTIVGLGKFCANDWWWWKGCQSALHPLSDLILERPRIS